MCPLCALWFTDTQESEEKVFQQINYMSAIYSSALLMWLCKPTDRVEGGETGRKVSVDGSMCQNVWDSAND